MIPMGWVQESVVMPKSTADDLNDLFLVDDAAAGIRFWGLVSAGICFAVILVLLYSSYDFNKQMKVDRSKYHLIENNQGQLGGGNIANPVATAPLLDAHESTSRF